MMPNTEAPAWSDSLHTVGTPAAQPPHQSKVLGRGGMGVRGKGGETFLQKGFPSLPPILPFPLSLTLFYAFHVPRISSQRP